MNDKRPKLGITMGDPAGVGPEISVKALANPRVYEISRPIIVGDANVIFNAAKMLGQDLDIRAVTDVRDALFEYGTIDVYDLKNVNFDELEIGKVSKKAGIAAYKAVEKVIELALKRDIDGTVTCPINKEAINLAGYHYSGHTEIFAELTNTKSYAMMLADENLRVVHVSTHVSLRKACDLVKKERILERILLANDACKKLGIEYPRIAVAALNPHAGENGLFGNEEKEEIIPAIEEARNFGINAFGPEPPDTVFSKARGGIYDIVVAMYHDQGHIPLKVVGFVMNPETGRWDVVKGVNITLGLPIVRSSVDHGTAFDQAWKGTASEASLINAIEYAARLAALTG